MSSKSTLRLIALGLVGIGVGLMAYKSIVLDFPLLPNLTKEVWTVEAKIEFDASKEPVRVSMALPQKKSNQLILEEQFTSPGYGFTHQKQEDNRRAEWTIREAEGRQTLYYRLVTHLDNTARQETPPASKPPTPTHPEYNGSEATSAKALIDYVNTLSVNPQSFAMQLVREINQETPTQNVAFLLHDNNSRARKTQLALDLLALAEIPSRIIRGLYLEDGRRKQPLVDLLEIYADGQWVVIDPETADTGIPENFIVWRQGDVSLLDVEGGFNSQVSFSIIRSLRPAKKLALEMAEDKQAALIDFSIYSLPIEEQNAYQSILLVPIGALIVVFLRIIIGIRTSGTFMPILIALTFIQTTLLTGLLLFLTVVGAGLIIRFYLTRLNLLLVARISAVVIVVIVIMSVISIASVKLGLNQTLTISFFPMIILSWTIERMSILWEEEGPHEVFVQGGGSLLVATLAYLAMSNSLIKHLTFNFPELLFILLAIILLLGQYTGYRLTELRRFQPMQEDRA